MTGLTHFMNGAWGRLLRVVVGLALIYWGWIVLGATTAGIVVAIIGLVPLIMGLGGRAGVSGAGAAHLQHT
ncbi:MAG: hypothetical protein ACE5F6_09015 [Anaerolineae bacterium]